MGLLAQSDDLNYRRVGAATLAARTSHSYP